MKIPESQTATTTHLMLWLIHRLAQEFQEHALLKGGMQLAMLSSHRETNDLDYTFVPFKSKKEVVAKIDQILSELAGAIITKSFHSTSGRYEIIFNKTNLQLEFNVSQDTPSTTVSTKLLAEKLGELPQVIRAMSYDVALSHKIAAWNERRLIRDLYDIYYWYRIVGIKPNRKVLTDRLTKFNSRLPRLRRIKSMTLEVLIKNLETELSAIKEKDYYEQLSQLFEKKDLEGTFSLFKSTLRELIVHLAKTLQN